MLKTHKIMFRFETVKGHPLVQFMKFLDFHEIVSFQKYSKVSKSDKVSSTRAFVLHKCS
jgi:hypothetical protein